MFSEDSYCIYCNKRIPKGEAICKECFEMEKKKNGK